MRSTPLNKKTYKGYSPLKQFTNQEQKEFKVNTRFDQQREIELRERQADDYVDFVRKSRGAYWLRAQVGLMLQYLQLRPNLRIYDAGAGVGMYSLKVAKEFPSARILAVDFSAASIGVLKREAQKRGLRNIETLVENIITYQPQPESYDRAICNEVLQHLPRHEARLAAVRRIYKCLKPEGLFATANYRWGGFTKPPAPKEEIDHENSGLVRFSFTEEELRALLEEVGFRNVRSFGIIRMPARIRSILPAWTACLAEKCLNALDWKSNNAQLVLAVGTK